MSETKFTPGPWKILPGQSLQEVVAPSKNGGAHKLIASLTESPLDPATCEANAQLIAAAPELLEGLEVALSWNDEDISGFEDITPTMPMLLARRAMFRRIIAKAKGTK